MEIMSWVIINFLDKLELIVVKSRELSAEILKFDQEKKNSEKKVQNKNFDVNTKNKCNVKGSDNDTILEYEGENSFTSSNKSACLVVNGNEWFELRRKKRKQNILTHPKKCNLLFRHPQKAPLVYSPINPTQPICRYHNYHPQGCKRFAESKCPLDHLHCHRCLARGHRAFSCLCYK